MIDRSCSEQEIENEVLLCRCYIPARNFSCYCLQLLLPSAVTVFSCYCLQLLLPSAVTAFSCDDPQLLLPSCMMCVPVQGSPAGTMDDAVFSTLKAGTKFNAERFAESMQLFKHGRSYMRGYARGEAVCV